MGKLNGIDNATRDTTQDTGGWKCGEKRVDFYPWRPICPMGVARPTTTESAHRVDIRNFRETFFKFHPYFAKVILGRISVRIPAGVQFRIQIIGPIRPFVSSKYIDLT